MQVLRAGFEMEAFFRAVSAAEQTALLVDYDGTLAPFHIDPMRAAPYPGVLDALEELAAEERTRLVIVSGRWTKDLVPLLPLLDRAEIWGAHGWERLMPDGTYEVKEVPDAALATLVAAEGWAEDLTELGARAERKAASIAFHWRGRPAEQVASIRRELLRRWSSSGSPNEVTLRAFDGGIEVRATGRDKGDVVRTLARECGGDAVIAYLGDDYTDEDAFGALPERGAGGLVRDAFRPTAAHFWLRPPAELLMFLERWHRARF